LSSLFQQAEIRSLQEEDVCGTTSIIIAAPDCWALKGRGGGLSKEGSRTS